MRVCFCVSSLFLLLVLFEEHHTPLKKKKEKEKVLVSIQIFKNFQKFLPSHDSKERATEHSLLSRATLNSGTRSKRAHSRSFVRTPLKSPFKCLKTLSQIRKSECIALKIHKSPWKRALRGGREERDIISRVFVTKNQKKKTPWCNSSVILISQPCASRRFRGGRARGKCNSFARYIIIISRSIDIDVVFWIVLPYVSVFAAGVDLFFLFSSNYFPAIIEFSPRGDHQKTTKFRFQFWENQMRQRVHSTKWMFFCTLCTFLSRCVRLEEGKGDRESEKRHFPSISNDSFEEVYLPP